MAHMNLAWDLLRGKEGREEEADDEDKCLKKMLRDKVFSRKKLLRGKVARENETDDEDKCGDWPWRMQVKLNVWYGEPLAMKGWR